MSGSHPRRTMPALGVAGAGLLVGHWLAYAFASPHAHARDELLDATGHGYLPYATQVALLAGALGLAALFIRRLHDRASAAPFAGEVAKLAAVQAAAFVAMEVGERLLSGASLHDLTHGPLLAIGLGVQLAVAIVGALMLRLTERAAHAAESLAPSLPPPPPGSLSITSIAWGTPRRPAMRATASRAPPSLP